MKLIEPSVEYIPQGEDLVGVYQQIEKCARICYKSEDKITEGSAEKIVNNLIANKHYAMLEHGTVYLKVELPDDEITPSASLYHYKKNPYSIYIVSNRVAYVTTNFRVIVENGWFNDLQYQCEPTEYHEKRYTFKFTTSRGIANELVRHRVFSFAQESSRQWRH